MRWGSALSEQATSKHAVAETIMAAARALDGARADLVVAFPSAHHGNGHGEILARLAEGFPEAVVVGCAARGVIGDGREIEERPALSLTAASLPGVTLSATHLDDPLPDGADAWRAALDLRAHAPAHFLLLVDPFTCDAEGLVLGLDEAYPGSTKVGGLASGGRTAGEGALYLQGAIHRTGAVVVGMTGNVAVETIVAQGCRPVGPPMVVTRAEDNIILELDKKRPAEALQQLFDGLDERDKTLFKTSLFLGFEMRDEQVEVRAGDFLVRNLMGMDRRTGALAVAAPVRPWQVVQFVLRDARTAEEDLTQLLLSYRSRGTRPEGALLFSCLGRGQHLFGAPDHDTNLFREHLGAVPLGGFFCNGEIGPVGGTTFLHGYTSAFGLFRPRH